jgi:hypothetical protein
MEYKLMRYLINTILFIVLWGVQLFLVTGFSFQYIREGPSGLIALGGIIALFTSYKLVKRINRSELWKYIIHLLNTTEEERLLEQLKEREDIKPTAEQIDEKTKEKTSEKYNSIIDELTKLGELKEKGLLTKKEFNEQKKKLLKQ